MTKGHDVSAVVEAPKRGSAAPGLWAARASGEWSAGRCFLQSLLGSYRAILLKAVPKSRAYSRFFGRPALEAESSRFKVQSSELGTDLSPAPLLSDCGFGEKRQRTAALQDLAEALGDVSLCADYLNFQQSI